MATCRSSASVVVLLILLLTDGVGGAKKKKKKRSSSTLPTVEARKAMMHHQQGVMAHVHGDADGAIAAFQRAIDAKPDFAYAYYRMGFVMEEVRKRSNSGASGDGSIEGAAALTAFQAAVMLDPSDEMARMALGRALHDRQRHDEATEVFQGIVASLNPRSAEAYWALGRVRSSSATHDEWEGDPSDPSDPTYWYEKAADLQPKEFHPDGKRVRKVQPDRRGERSNAENEARQEAEASERRQRVLEELQDGTRKLTVATDEEDLEVDLRTKIEL